VSRVQWRVACQFLCCIHKVCFLNSWPVNRSFSGLWLLDDLFVGAYKNASGLENYSFHL
jgi:hypothetical protein